VVGGPGPSLLGAGDIDTMQGLTSTRTPDITTTLSHVCSLSVASAHPPISTGKERDAESGNDYFEARYYSSSMGRFMSPDDFWQDTNLADPQSLNKYAYSRNNPLRYIDPTGETATVSQSCSTTNGQTTCNTNITASIAIYAAPGSGITQDQMNGAKAAITSSIDKAWSGSYSQDGVTYNVTTSVSVSVVGSQSAGEQSGAQNVVGLSNGPANSKDNAVSGLGRNVGQDEGKWDINRLGKGEAAHEFTHLMGVDDRDDFSLVLSNTNPFRRPMPMHATSQDFGWALKESTAHVNAAMDQMKKTGACCGPVKDTTTVGAPRNGDWK
jgi:RHS repeat-associated protein